MKIYFSYVNKIIAIKIYFASSKPVISSECAVQGENESKDIVCLYPTLCAYVEAVISKYHKIGPNNYSNIFGGSRID